MPASVRLDSPRLAAAALLLNALIWGLSWWPFRWLDAHGLHPLWSTAAVYGAALVLTVARQPGDALAALRQPALLGLLASSGLTNACFNWGVSIGEVVRVVLLFYLMPVWSMLLARWWLGEALRPVAVALAMLALAGAMLILWEPGAGLPMPASLGDWLGLAGGVGFAMTNVLLRRQAHDAPGARAAAMFAGGMLIPATVALIAGGLGHPVPLPRPDAQAWLPLGVFAAAFMLANLALQFGAARLPARVTAVVMLSEVVFAAVSAAWLAGEMPGHRALIGAALILGASLLAAWREGRNP